MNMPEEWLAEIDPLKLTAEDYDEAADDLDEILRDYFDSEPPAQFMWSKFIRELSRRALELDSERDAAKALLVHFQAENSSAVRVLSNYRQSAEAERDTLTSKVKELEAALTKERNEINRDLFSRWRAQARRGGLEDARKAEVPKSECAWDGDQSYLTGFWDGVSAKCTAIRNMQETET